MEMRLRLTALVLPLFLFGCATPYNELEKPEVKFIKIEPVNKLKLRDVKVLVNSEGYILLSPKDYENLSKNMSDIYSNQKLLKEQVKFYERQMFE